MAQIKALSAELQKIANDELGEVPARMPEDLQNLKSWIEQQPHLKARLDDQFLLQFLRGCKYSLERAKEKVDLYFFLKSKYPDMLNVVNVDDQNFRDLYRLGCFLTLPTPLHESGPRLVVFQFAYSTSKHNIDGVFQTGCGFHEILLVRDPYACIRGLVYIVDFDKATASHFLQLTPNFCKKMVSFLEKSMPLRIKSIYYINTSTAAQQFFKILFPFFSDKLKERIHVIGSGLGELHKDIPPKYLPKDYGGELPSLSQLAIESDKIWDENREFFKENANYGTDESLRLGKPVDVDGLFGVGGSFRKLNVD